MKSYNLLILLTVLAFAFASCEKEEDHDHSEWTISILSPTGGQVFENGDTIPILGAIEHNHTIHEYAIELTNVSTGEKVFSFSDHVHTANSVDFDTFWVNNVTDHSDMKLTVSAVDHDDNKGEESVEFHCHPL